VSKLADSIVSFWFTYGDAWDACEVGGAACICPAVGWIGNKKSCARHGLSEIANDTGWRWYTKRKGK
jgi:hypothetical protein